MWGGPLVLGNSVEYIGEYAFQPMLYNIPGDLIIPDSVTYIAKGAFNACGFDGVLVLGNSVETIGESAFCYNNFVGEVIIPDSVISIGKSAFANCKNITSVVIGSGVWSIRERAFENCKNITSVVIGSRVGEIEARAFYNCPIKKVYFKGDAPFVVEFDNENRSFNSDVTLYYTEGADGWPDSDTWQGYKIHKNVFEISMFVTSYNWIFDVDVWLYKDGEVVSKFYNGKYEVADIVTQDIVLKGISEGVYDIVLKKRCHLDYTIKNVIVDDDLDLRDHENPLISAIKLVGGDINSDGYVDLNDLTCLTSDFTYNKSIFDNYVWISADINGDEVCDLKDLVIMTSSDNYGKSPVEVDY
jgi:hypothetical protein